MRQIIIDAIKEEIDASIDATDLTTLKLDAEERRRLNNEVNYKGKSYRNQNINDLLIDYSSKDLNEEQILALLENKVFQQKLVSNEAYYIVRPVFKYLLESEDSSIVNRTVALYFEKYKKCFKTINFERSARLGYEPKIRVLEYLANLENMNKGLDDKFVKKIDYEDIYRLAGYTFTPQFYQRAYGTIEREHMQSGCRELKTFTPLVDEYTFSDVSKSNFVYAYKTLIKELNKDQSDRTKEEIELILETINTLGKLNRDDEKEAIFTNAETLNRIFVRCDKAGIELSDKAVNQLAYEVLRKDRKYQELKQTIQQLYLLYIKTHYDSNVKEFVDMINRDYNYDFSSLFDGKSDKKLTVEMLESFVRGNNIYFVKLLGDHLSTEKYVQAQEFGITTGVSLNENESNVKRGVLTKYQSKLRELKALKDRTIEYYIYMNIPEEDRDSFINLFHYWCRNGELDEKQFQTPAAKKGVYEVVCEQMQTEILNSSYIEIGDIVKKYKQLLVKFNSYRSYEKLKLFRSIVEKSRFKKADEEVSRYLQLISKGLKNNENIYLLFNKNNIPIKAFEDVLNNENSAYVNIKGDINHIVNKYHRDYEEIKSTLEKEKNAKEKQEKYDQSVELVKQFINSATSNVKDFLDEANVHKKTFASALDVVRNSSLEVYNEYTKKIMEQSKQRFIPVLQNVQEIVYKILNGVEEPDDVRQFDYLDFKLATRMTLQEFADFAKKQKVVTEPDDIRRIMEFSAINAQNKPTTPQQIYDELNIINGKEIVLPIKKAIIAYLKSFGIIDDYKAYRIALTRFLNHKLDLTPYYEEPFDEEGFFNIPKTK